MSLSPRARWAVPAVAAVAVAGAFITPPLLASASDAGLPDVTPAGLVAEVAAAKPVPMSGTAVYTAHLGLPQLPVDQMTGADPLALLSGSSTLRVWTDGSRHSRVSLLGSTSEYSVVQDGPQAWTYSSAKDAVVHYSLDATGKATYAQAAKDAEAGKAVDGSSLGVAGDLPTPEQAGEQALTQAQTTSTISLDAQSTVAGRDVYQLVVTPKSTTTLVGHIVVAVDAKTKTPLRVQVWSSADAKAPALELGYTDVSFAAPDASVLAFSAPPGATTKNVTVPLPTPAKDGVATGDLPDGVTVTGTGWDSVATWSGVDVAGLIAGDPSAVAGLPGAKKTFDSEGAQDLYNSFVEQDASGNAATPGLDKSALYDQLTTKVPQGRLLTSNLVSILVTDDGRVLVGAVPGDTLRAQAR